MEMEDGDIMVFELYPEFAPETVENFVGLVESGFYDGLKFHRIIEGFMIQSGDPKGNGTGGSDKTISGEFAKNNFSQNTLKHTSGVISMARSNNPDSASSQFFIMDGTATSLDGSYAAFGKLIEGEDTLSLIAKTEVVKNPMSGEKSLPVKDVFIKRVTLVETK
ncbi:MAG: peptidylprolyl isomerase [Bacillota bacterium]|nr:peptidylprolyl isomerase [Bacillota bacterium]